jgi:hypothetical protein
MHALAFPAVNKPLTIQKLVTGVAKMIFMLDFCATMNAHLGFPVHWLHVHHTIIMIPVI